MSGKPSVEAAKPDASVTLERWAKHAVLTFFTFSYMFDVVKPVSLAELRDALREAPSRTGWNVWWVPTRNEIAPSIVDDAVECWLGGDTSEHQQARDSAHADFWRVSPNGCAFLLRGYQEDGEHAIRVGIEPGTNCDLTVPICQWADPMGYGWGAGVSKEDAVSLSTQVDLDAIGPNLLKIVHTLLSPLYDRFDFSRLPTEIVQRELDKLLKRAA